MNAGNDAGVIITTRNIAAGDVNNEYAMQRIVIFAMHSKHTAYHIALFSMLEDP